MASSDGCSAVTAGICAAGISPDRGDGIGEMPVRRLKTEKMG
jgi:hypothetical protein